MTVNLFGRRLSKDLLSTVLNQGWKLISGPLMLLSIPIFLSPETQGFWYAFASLAALVVFADLGFTNIVLQFSAHEFAHLSYSPEAGIAGDAHYLDRLASLFRFVFKWIATVSAVFFPIVFVVGILLFRSRASSIDWFAPWVLYSLSSGLIFVCNTMLSFLEGCDQVAGAQRIRFEMGMIGTAVTVTALALHLELFAISLNILSAMIVFMLMVWIRYRKFFANLLHAKRIPDVGWRKSIVRLLWRTAISYSSGYFIFQLYTPVMFRFHGPVDAGKVGISISLWSAIFAISSVWVTAVTPKANILVARRNWDGLDHLIRTNIWRSLATFAAATLGAFLVIALLHGRIAIVDRILNRFMSPIALATLGVGWTFQVIINGLAVYLRAHKQEPFVATSVVSAAIISVSTVLCAMFLPSDWFFLGFAGSYLIVFPWILIMFRNKKRLWHAAPSLEAING